MGHYDTVGYGDLMGKDRFYAKICKNVENVEHLIGTKRIDPKMRSFMWKKLRIPVDLEHPTERAKDPWFGTSQCYYYHIDIDNGQLSFRDIEDEVSKDTTDLIFSREIVKQLASAQRKSGMSGDYVFLFIGALAGVGLGWIICQLITGSV